MRQINYLVTYVHGDMTGMYGVAARDPEHAVERTEQFVRIYMPVFYPERFAITKVESIAEGYDASPH